MDWPIHEIARVAGTTSRTLRHYGDIGLLEPSRIGGNGYRYYDEAALVRLQRILMLRQLGLGLPAIGDILERQADAGHALLSHLRWLEQERDRLARQIASVEKTIQALEGGERLMAENMFDGFDHSRYREEVEERWGTEAYARSDAWWSALSPAQKKDWMQHVQLLVRDWSEAAASGIAPESDEAQTLARRQFEWLAGVPGTPGSGTTGPTKEYFVGLGEMYVADPRFGANYGGQAGAEFVRDAMRVYADREL
ncbi:MerR family transcriptional regulator [Compostimonas suwonensis]|uniref:DNA-binding transcriptional MerR regulator n=1 Tax=Compostimonas suwonensis TaxID=1048394 RepID=A0A2M9C4R3_9MICO|nr:MerR family transcriptional regulator [Compostimonas suwonensis]PJJ65515.1 DNA-binding transcriptional MerR regulator [Compostimonas suwonensis]